MELVASASLQFTPNHGLCALRSLLLFSSSERSGREKRLGRTARTESSNPAGMVEVRFHKPVATVV